MWKRISVVVVLVLLVLATAFVFRPDGPTVKEVGMNRTTTSGDGTTIAYTKLGSGPPLILVDGAFCYRENGPTSKLAPLLAEHFTVFAYDRRGRGASGAHGEADHGRRGFFVHAERQAGQLHHGGRRPWQG